MISYQQIQINLGISKNEITRLNLLGMLSSVSLLLHIISGNCAKCQINFKERKCRENKGKIILSLLHLCVSVRLSVCLLWRPIYLSISCIYIHLFDHLFIDLSSISSSISYLNINISSHLFTYLFAFTFSNDSAL